MEGSSKFECFLGVVANGGDLKENSSVKKYPFFNTINSEILKHFLFQILFFVRFLWKVYLCLQGCFYWKLCWKVLEVYEHFNIIQKHLENNCVTRIWLGNFSYCCPNNLGIAKTGQPIIHWHYETFFRSFP